MGFSHWYQMIGSEPLLENDPDSFVARLKISPPRAGVFASCQLQATNSSALLEEENKGEFSSAVCHGWNVFATERTGQKTQSVRDCISIILQNHSFVDQHYCKACHNISTHDCRSCHLQPDDESLAQ